MKFRALFVALLATAAVAHAGKQTVCTVTVNSPDERDIFREYLPADRFDFVELVENGRSDWLASSCRKGVKCDVLLVSGHFAGTEFYSSRLANNETLPVDEIERVGCSESCPGLFSELKEVYLFGCDTLNSTPVRSVTPEVIRSLEREGLSPVDAARRAAELGERHGESALEHMRRLFPDVPVIYGFTSKAPYGKVAGPMLRQLLQAPEDVAVGSGVVSEKLYRMFAPASMTVTNGLRMDEPNADYRAQACRYFDDRLTPARKLREIHATLVRSMAEARLSLDQFEKFMATSGESAHDAGFSAALAEIATDIALRARFLTLTRDTPDPAVRVRLIALAQGFGWLTPAEQRAETMRMVGDLLAESSTDFGEVDLICTLNRDGSLGQALDQLRSFPLRAGRAADAAMACLGDSGSRARILTALASRDEREVRIAQAYLRHQPIVDGDELRGVALGVAKMQGSSAQARAIETLARSRVTDAAVFDEFKRLYVRAGSLAVQRAVAEAFIRWDYRDNGLAQVLRKYRLRSPDGADVIDTLIGRL
ncbi:MAG: hypothetical protein ABI669_01245 [Usitatibacter sp.]